MFFFKLLMHVDLWFHGRKAMLRLRNLELVGCYHPYQDALLHLGTVLSDLSNSTLLKSAFNRQLASAKVVAKL